MPWTATVRTGVLAISVAAAVASAAAGCGQTSPQTGSPATGAPTTASTPTSAAESGSSSATAPSDPTAGDTAAVTAPPADPGEQSIDKARLSRSIEDYYQQSAGSVVCQGDLSRKVGSSTRCTFADGDGITVTVSGANADGTSQLDYVVD